MTASWRTGSRCTSTNTPRIDLVREALARLGPLGGMAVCDIGCGNGSYLTALAKGGAAAVGLDLSAGMLKAVPEGSAGTVVADAQWLPLRTASLDTAIGHGLDRKLSTRRLRLRIVVLPAEVTRPCGAATIGIDARAATTMAVVKTRGRISRPSPSASRPSTSRSTTQGDCSPKRWHSYWVGAPYLPCGPPVRAALPTSHPGGQRATEHNCGPPGVLASRQADVH
jgi:SAM-dependent methyltransferase